MRWICLPLGLLILLFLPAHAGHSPPKIFLRIYVQTTGEGLPETQAHTIAVPPNNETIQIRAFPELTEAELVDVRTDASGNTLLVFNREGQVALDTVTAQDQGRILVVFINGYIVYAPTIDEHIVNGELLIPHPIKPEVLQVLRETAQKNVAEAKRS